MHLRTPETGLKLYPELHALHSKFDPFKMYVVHWVTIVESGRHLGMPEIGFNV